MPIMPALRPEQHDAVAFAPVVVGEVPSAGGVQLHQRRHPARSVKVRPLIAEAQMHFDHAPADGLDIQHAGVAAQVTRDPFAAVAFDLELAIHMHGPVIERALARRLAGDVAPPARLAGDDSDVGAHAVSYTHLTLPTIYSV